MKKKILLFLLAFMCFIGGNYFVSADAFGYSFVCDSNVADGDLIKCQLRLSGTGDPNIKEISGNFSHSDNFIFDHIERSSYITSGTDGKDNFKYSSSTSFPLNFALFTVYYKVNIGSDYSEYKDVISLDVNVDAFGAGNVTSNDIIFDKYHESKLSSLSVKNHTLSPSFDPNTNQYKVTTKESAITVVGTLKDQNSSTNIKDLSNHVVSLEYGANEVEIVVTAQDKSTRTYEVIITREDDRNDDTKLQLLNVAGKNIVLEDDKYNYSIDVDNSIIDANLIYAPSASTSKVEVDGDELLSVGENNYTITVTSERGSISKYILVVNRLDKELSSDSSIKKLTIDNLKNEDFKFISDDYSYKVVIDSSIESLKFDITLNDTTAKYEILDNKNLVNDSKVVVKVTAEDGTFTNYTFLVQVEKNSNIVLYVVIGIIVLVAAAIIITILVLKKKKSKNNVVQNNDSDETADSIEIK